MYERVIRAIYFRESVHVVVGRKMNALVILEVRFRGTRRETRRRHLLFAAVLFGGKKKGNYMYEVVRVYMMCAR